MITEGQRTEMVSLFCEGLSHAEIGRQLGLSKRIICRYTKEMGYTRPPASGERNFLWKGDDVGNQSLHDWVRRHLLKPSRCQRCGLVPPFDLANKSGDYKRALTNWWWICRKCHVESDGRLANLIQNSRMRKAAREIAKTL